MRGGKKERNAERKKEEKALGITNHVLSFDTTRTAWKTTPPIIFLLPRMFLCRIKVFTEPLPSNDRLIHIHTD
jgi:hypothetical protein